MRFCSESCYQKNFEKHKLIHNSVHGRAKKYASQFIDISRSIIIRQGSPHCSQEELQPLLDQESKLAEEVEIIKYCASSVEISNCIRFMLPIRLRIEMWKLHNQILNAKPAPPEETPVEAAPRPILPPASEVTTYEELFAYQKKFHQEIADMEELLSELREQVKRDIFNEEELRSEMMSKAVRAQESFREKELLVSHLTQMDGNQPDPTAEIEEKLNEIQHEIDVTAAQIEEEDRLLEDDLVSVVLSNIDLRSNCII